jgi:hypothetical protein
MPDPASIEARFITQITITDPDSHAPVELEVWKDPSSGGLFGIDASFLDQIEEHVASPFNPDIILHLGVEGVGAYLTHE